MYRALAEKRAAKLHLSPINLSALVPLPEDAKQIASALHWRAEVIWRPHHFAFGPEAEVLALHFRLHILRVMNSTGAIKPVETPSIMFRT